MEAENSRRKFMNALAAGAIGVLAGARVLDAAPLEFKTYQVGAFKEPEKANALARELRRKGLEAAVYPDEDYSRVAIPTFHPMEALYKKTGIEGMFPFKDKRYVAAAAELSQRIPEITPEGLLTLAHVVNQEVTPTNDRDELVRDMKAIVHNIMNRLFAASRDKDLMRDFNEGGTASLEGILRKKGQYSAMSRRSLREKILRGIQTKNLIYEVKEAPDMERLMLAYEVAKNTIRAIVQNPQDDPTSGSLMYKNSELTDELNGRKIVWNGKRMGGYLRKASASIGEHTYYILLDEKNRNLGRSYRQAYFWAQRRTA